MALGTAHFAMGQFDEAKSRERCASLEKIAIQCPDQKPSRYRQPNLLAFSAGLRRYLGKLGLYFLRLRQTC